MAAEAKLERKLCEAVKQAGGIALKFTSPGFTGVPDRIVLLPGGTLVFAELKAPKGVVSARQRLVHQQLQKLGFTTFLVVGEEGLETFKQHLQTLK